MGEIIKPDFSKKENKQPLSPLKHEVIERGFNGEKKFSKNGVIEYTNGVPPRDHFGVATKVKFHIGPMERTILQKFPEKSIRSGLFGEMREIFDAMDDLALLKTVEDSDLSDWIEEPDEWLAVIDEIRRRNLEAME